jgi:hypothetical protein
MKSPRPSFEKKEMAVSSSPYVYLPMDIPHTVWRSHTGILLTANCSSAPWTGRFSECPI